MQFCSDTTGKFMVATHKLMPYAAVLAAALTLSACSGGDPAPGVTGAAPTAVGTSTGTPTSRAPSTSPTSTKAEDPVLAKIPKAARAETQKGAEAFAVFFLSSLNTAARNADPTVLEGLYSKECGTCQNMQATIKEFHVNGEHHDQDSLKILKVSTLVYAEEQKAVRVDVDQRPVNIVDKNGRVVQRTEAAKSAFAVTLKPTGSHWVVYKLQRVAS